jgi:PAS domain S-box-containing protein
MKYLRKLIAPIFIRQDESPSLPAKLLLMIVLAQLLLLLGVVAVEVFVFNHELDFVFWSHIGIISALIPLYWLSRRGYVQGTGLATIMIIVLAVAVEVYFSADPDRLNYLFYLLFVLLLGVLMLSFKQNIALFVVLLLAMLSLPWMLPDITWDASLFLPVRIYVTMGIIVLLLSWHRDQRGLIQRKVAIQSEMRLQRISDQLPGVVYQVEQRPDGSVSFTYVSDGFQSLYKVSPEDAQLDADRVFDLLHPEDKDRFWASIGESIQTMDQWSCEYRLQFPDGAVRWLLDTAMPVSQPDGSILWHGFVSDVTEQRSAQYKNQLTRDRLQAILQAIPDLLFELDEEGQIQNYLSRRTPALIVPPDQFLGRRIDGFLPHDAAKIIMGAITYAVEHGQSTGVEYQMKTPSGLRWFELTLARMATTENKPQRFIAMEREITVRKQAEQRLAQQNQYLAMMHEITLELLNRRDRDELLQVVVEQAAIFLDAPYSEVLLKDGDSLVTSACTGHLSFVKGERVHRGDALLSWQAYDTGKPAILEDYSSWEHRRSIYSSVQLKAVADFPIMIGQECLGVLGLARDQPDSPFTPEQINQGILLAQLVALVLDNVNLYDAALRDLAERRQAEEDLRASEARFRALFDHSPDGIFLLDYSGEGISGRIVDCNEAACLMNGYRRDELIGEPMEILCNRLCPEDLRRLETERLLTYEVHHHYKNGTRFPVSVSARTININGRDLVIAIHRDVTRDLLIREQLQQAKDNAEAATRAKSAFLASMSHEIRTPMNGVIGMADLLLDTELSHTQQEYVQIVQKSGKHLLTIINDILDFSKIEANKLTLDLEDFDLSDILEETVDVLALTASRKNLELACFLEPNTFLYLQGDPGRLRQVLMNLVGNAIKFTSEGEVVVSVSTFAIDEATVTLRFEVKDTGIGISPSQKSKLFQAFGQLDSSITRNYGGTGLGLAISRELVSRMGGEIGVTNNLEKGSIFWFTVVLSKQRNPPSFTASTSPHLEGRRILVVGDKVISRRHLATYLDAWRCTHTEAEDIQSALNLLKTAQAAAQPFELLLVDMEMPVKDGTILAQALRSTPELSTLPLILLTSYEHSAEVADKKPALFTEIMNKPIRQSRLYNSLTTLLNPTTAPKASLVSHTATETPFAHGRTYRILVVDDNIVNQKVGLTLLERLGLNADSVADGAEAIEALTACDYDLVLMDVQMPVMDGYTATQAIRAPGSKVLNPAIPIIAMTADALDGDREKCLAAGMNGYVSKPIQRQELRNVLERWLTESTQPASEDAHPVMDSG